MSISDDHLVDLLLIPGVGRVKARVLYDNGFRSLADLVECPFEELASIPRIGPGLASSIKEYAQVMADVSEETEDKLETTTGLSMCPMCGSLLADNAEACPNCGIAFEDDGEVSPEQEPDSAEMVRDPDAPDGYWYKEEKTQFFLCPECGAMISEDAEKCHNCGVAFDPNEVDTEQMEAEPEMDTEVQELADMLVDKTDEDLDGHWYKDEAQLFLCPGCGAFISVDARKCDTCGIEFDDDVAEDHIPEMGADIELIEHDIPDSIEHKEEETQFFLCTECGAFISENAPKCDTCGAIFDTREAEVGTGEIEKEPHTPSPDDMNILELEELDGFDLEPDMDMESLEDMLGMEFDEATDEVVELKELAEMLVTAEAIDDTGESKVNKSVENEEKDDLDGHWYKDKAELYLCPNCGAFISAGAHECEICGIVFMEGGEEVEPAPEPKIEGLDIPDDQSGKEEMTQFFLCPECGALISEDAANCANCGTGFEPSIETEEPASDNEIQELANMLIEKSDSDLDGHWYKDEAELYLCPNCGAFISASAHECEVCGAEFEGSDEELASAPVMEPTEPDIPDRHGYEREEMTQIFLCTDCGALISEDAASCANCGAIYADEVSEGEGEQDDEMKLRAEREIDELSNLLVETTSKKEAEEQVDMNEKWKDASSELQLCPGCGAFVFSDIMSCPDCGISLGIVDREVEKDMGIEGMELEDIELEDMEPEAETHMETVPKPDRIEVDGFELLLTDESDNEVDDELAGLELGDIQPHFVENDNEILSLDIDEDDGIETDDLSDIDLLKELEPDMEEIDLLKELEDDLDISEFDTGKEEKKGISKDFLSRWARLGDEPEEEEDITPSLSSKEFFTQLMENEDEEDGGLPDIVDIEMEMNDVIVLENLETLNQKIEDDPGNHELYARKARLLAKAGSFEDAIANYDRAAELNVDKEGEYRKRILEILQGTAISDQDDELDGLELDTVRQETNEIKTRLIEIDEDLGLFPGTKGLLQEKGELLDKLGMHEAALECYDQVIQSSYREIESTSRQRPTEESGSLQVGLVNGQGRVNGRTNGLTNGKTRGRTNGLTNGKVNGLVNGKINGLGKVNGMINGLTNGKVNGHLLQLGNRGLINGMSLINGDGLASGHARLRGQRAKFRATSAWRVRITLMAFLIFIMMFMPVLTNMMISDETYGMNIDGNFADWVEFSEYQDSPVDQINNGDINIISSKVNFRPPNLYLYLQVEGEILGGKSNEDVLGMDSIFIFIDSDADPSTGYSISDIGADILLDASGWSNTINRLEVRRFSEGADQDDWNAFSFSHTGVGALVHGELELRVTLNELNSLSQPNMIIATQDSFGRMDISDSTITPFYGTLKASVMEAVEGDIINPGDNDASLIRLEAFGRRAEASAMTFTQAGELEVGDMTGLRVMMDTNGNNILDTPDIEIPTVLESNEREFTLTFNTPRIIEVGEAQSMFLDFDVADDTQARNVGVELSGIRVSDGTIVHIAVNAGGVHNIGTPSSITIDGAFGDWENVEQNIDSANDVMSGDMDFNSSHINRNVDIGDYRMMVDDRLLIYTSVAGVAMGGVDIPMIRYRHIVSEDKPIITPPPPPDSDNDGVPDALDGPNGSMAHDFNNDGVSDADSMGDRDGDGILDHSSGGTDNWLETVIPDDYDANYSGMEIRRYIGPVQHQEKKGLDYLSIYIDSDNDLTTGAYVNGMVGADHLMLISGRNNNILSSELYSYIPDTINPWELVDDINAALDYHRMEMGVSLSLIGLTSMDEFSVYIEISDWKNSRDTSDDMIVNMPMITGTRSIAGDNVVMNEMATLPDGAEWIEVANPTNLPIDLSGWYIQVQFFGWRTIYTFPGGTTAGAWGSGSEYVLANDPFTGPWWFFGNQLRDDLNVRLRDSSGNIIDATTIGTVGAGQTWSRFKNATYGMPTDTDNDANDWYVSNNGWIVPEGPTPGAPNDRRRPVILVEKVGNLSVTAPNTQVQFTINYDNIGDGLARNVWINDTLPSGMTYVSSSVPYTSVTGSTYTWRFTNIAPGTTNSFTITALVGAGVPLGTTLTNLAELNYTDQLNRPMEYSSDTWDVLVSGPIPVITVEKAASSAEVSPSGWLSYTIWYNNTGTANAGNGWINDTLPADISFDSASPSPNSTAGQTQYWHFVNVPPGTHSITLYGNVSGGAVIGSTLTNTVTLNYTDLLGNPQPSSSDSASVTVVEPSFQILINEIRVNNNNDEWLEVVNPTNVPVDISDWIIWVGNTIYTFPAGTILGAFGSGSEFYVADVGGGNDFPNAGSTVYLAADIGGWMIIDQTTYPGGITTAQTWSRFKHEDTGIPVDTDNDANDFYISNNAWIVPEGPTPGGHNDRKRPVMNVEKTADISLAEPGDMITYTIWYNNTGDGNAKQVWVNDTLPANVDFISANPTPTSNTGSSYSWYFANVIHDSINSIIVTVRVNATASDGEILVNQADLAYRDQLKRPMTPSSSWANVTCNRPNITVEKIANVTQAYPGDSITYTIYYNNTGSINAGDVWINDTLPSGVTLTGASPSPTSTTGLTSTWHFTNVAPGTHSITITVTVNLTAPAGTISNWAYLNYTSANGWPLESSSDSADVTVIVIPEFKTIAPLIMGMMALMFMGFRRRREMG